jgi:hypothetical protein
MLKPKPSGARQNHGWQNDVPEFRISIILPSIILPVVAVKEAEQAAVAALAITRPLKQPAASLTSCPSRS